MRASFTTLLALAATALAANIPVRGENGLVGRTYEHGGGGGGHGGDDDHDKGKDKDKDHPGKDKDKCKHCETTTKTKTYTTTSTVETKVPTTIVITKTGEPVTKTSHDGKHCPSCTECKSPLTDTHSCLHHSHRAVPRD